MKRHVRVAARCWGVGGPFKISGFFLVFLPAGRRAAAGSRGAAKVDGHGADFVIVDDVQGIPGLRLNGDAGCEAAESWQNEALARVLPPETRRAE